MKNREKITLVQVCIISVMIYFLLAAIFYYVGNEQIKYNNISSTMAATEKSIGEITDKVTIEQSFIAETDILNSVTIAIATYARENKGEWTVKLLDSDKKVTLSESKIDISKLKDNSNYTVGFNKKIVGKKGKKLFLQLTSSTPLASNAITAYYNTNQVNAERTLIVNNEKKIGELCFSVTGQRKNLFGTYYLVFVLFGAIVLSCYCLNIISKEKNGKMSFVMFFYKVSVKYKFLIKQLISRDFKTKYKRSVLGFLWSFLNPLFTMIIQYIVFSTIFKSNIDNFPVYLLTGSIFFNFFTESVGVGLLSIIGNTSLISKVYVPKYIYPVTRVLSTSINLFISLVPLLFTIIVTGENITKAYILIVFVIVCIIVFCIGMSFILSSAMVFFRDTQFLWGIVSLLWMYATPLFYPENIIPEKYTFILDINPMYYFIKFARTIFLDGVSPQPILYLQCIFCSLVTFVFGAWVFKKSQDKFILYL